MEKTIKSVQDLYDMLDADFRSAKQFWEPFYEDRNRPIPFFPNKPDENLVTHVNAGLLTGGKALELGCGPGRNALYLTRQGYQVDAYDLSETAIAWLKRGRQKSNWTCTLNVAPCSNWPQSKNMILSTTRVVCTICYLISAFPT